MADAIVAVRGCASADVDPEIARVVIGISARERDRLAAVEALAKADAAVWAVLSSYAGAVERSRSEGVQVWGESGRPAKPTEQSASRELEPARASLADARPGRSKGGKSKGARRRVVGHAAQVWYEITVGDFAVLEEMLSALAEQSGVELVGPSWALRSNSPVFGALRAEAVRQARARAAEYAEAAGATLTGLVDLAEAGLAPSCDDEAVLPRAAHGGDETRPSWVIQPARQSVSVSVDARFSMSQPYFP